MTAVERIEKERRTVKKATPVEQKPVVEKPKEKKVKPSRTYSYYLSLVEVAIPERFRQAMWSAAEAKDALNKKNRKRPSEDQIRNNVDRIVSRWLQAEKELMDEVK